MKESKMEHKLSREEIEDIWDEARLIAEELLEEYALSGGFSSMNPYEIGSLRHEEYEAAHEHYIMKGLGY